ncbi:hypothetical protein V7S43_016166 [Phytophthora oleae]|uniref:RxLR effector protein n=1 Tax=Phytophthora oleae TaxID=2107226 RepID=A0ABD3EW94_9STRA
MKVSIYVLAFLLSAVVTTADSTPIIRGLRDETATGSLDEASAAGNEEKVCYFLFWPFQC